MNILVTSILQVIDPEDNLGKFVILPIICKSTNYFKHDTLGINEILQISRAYCNKNNLKMEPIDCVALIDNESNLLWSDFDPEDTKYLIMNELVPLV